MLNLIKRLFRLGLLAGIAYGVYKLYQEYISTPGGELGTDRAVPVASVGDNFEVDLSKLGGAVSQDLLDILVCPLDKGKLVLIDDQWLVNPRNGYRYPIVDGIPVMLIEVGEKYKDETLIEQP